MLGQGLGPMHERAQCTLGLGELNEQLKHAVNVEHAAYCDFVAGAQRYYRACPPCGVTASSWQKSVGCAPDRCFPIVQQCLVTRFIVLRMYGSLFTAAFGHILKGYRNLKLPGVPSSDPPDSAACTVWCRHVSGDVLPNAEAQAGIHVLALLPTNAPSGDGCGAPPGAGSARLLS